MIDPHPEIAARRKQHRKLAATLRIYNNGDVEWTIPEEFKIKSNRLFLINQLDDAEARITEALK
jgi:hypothetical protein